MASNEKLRQSLKKLVYAIVIVLVFEGITRKLLPSVLGLVVFFVKDILCVIGLALINKAKIDNQLKVLIRTWKFLLIAFIPLFINTLFKDTVLVFFSIKEYLLYVVVGILVPVAFPPAKYKEFKKFILFITVLVVPTTLVAMLQNALPPTHWLNLSVGGNSLEAFSAAGFLRVSSTFSFTGQYSWFLNILCAILAIRICLEITPQKPFFKKINSLVIAAFCILLLIGAFITGGRTAVLGCGASLSVGFIFASIKAPKKFIFQGMKLILGLVLCLIVLRTVKPEFFAAYDQRSSGTEEQSHSKEVGERVLFDFFGWTTWLFKEDTMPLIFGNGLGVMTNGSDKISSYAADIRATYWTETDVATAAWEGGLYMMIVWYGFRIWIISLVFKIWKKTTIKNVGIAMSFLLAYIIIVGLYGTISSQPPLAIWWWLSVGIVFTINNYYSTIAKLNSPKV